MDLKEQVIKSHFRAKYKSLSWPHNAQSACKGGNCCLYFYADAAAGSGS